MTVEMLGDFGCSTIFDVHSKNPVLDKTVWKPNWETLFKLLTPTMNCATQDVQECSWQTAKKPLRLQSSFWLLLWISGLQFFEPVCLQHTHRTSSIPIICNHSYIVCISPQQFALKQNNCPLSKYCRNPPDHSSHFMMQNQTYCSTVAAASIGREPGIATGKSHTDSEAADISGFHRKTEQKPFLFAVSPQFSLQTVAVGSCGFSLKKLKPVLKTGNPSFSYNYLPSLPVSHVWWDTT